VPDGVHVLRAQSVASRARKAKGPPPPRGAAPRKKSARSRARGHTPRRTRCGRRWPAPGARVRRRRSAGQSVSFPAARRRLRPRRCAAAGPPSGRALIKPSSSVTSSGRSGWSPRGAAAGRVFSSSSAYAAASGPHSAAGSRPFSGRP
jgi:hypothetical protein